MRHVCSPDGECFCVYDPECNPGAVPIEIVSAGKVARLTEERDAWIRKYTRLEGAVNAHQKADRFKDDHDDALYRVRDKLNEGAT